MRLCTSASPSLRLYMGVRSSRRVRIKIGQRAVGAVRAYCSHIDGVAPGRERDNHFNGARGVIGRSGRTGAHDQERRCACYCVAEQFRGR